MVIILAIFGANIQIFEKYQHKPKKYFFLTRDIFIDFQTMWRENQIFEKYALMFSNERNLKHC